MDTTLRRTWAEIDLDNLAHNLSVIRRQVGPNARLMGVVKADAYGHGAVRIARELARQGCSYLAVSNLDECEELRRHGIALPILVLGYSPADQTARILENQVTQSVQSYEVAKAFSDAAVMMHRKMKVHITLDTGMGRLGFQCDNASFAASRQDILAVLRLPGLEVEGVFTHFCVSDETDQESQAYTALQYDRFRRMIGDVERLSGFSFALHHCCNGGAIAHYPQWAWDMVRCGIILYGSGSIAQKMGMKPVMRIKTAVSTIKTYPAGSSIGYGRKFTTQRDSRIAVLPIGYADGLFRSLSGKLQVATPYGLAQQVGQICMDMCMIDCTDLPQLKSGDEIEVFGEQVPAEDNARAIGTISYELLCAISKRVPRHYIQGGVCVGQSLQILDQTF